MRVLALGAALALLADVPLGATPFTRGDVLRGVAVPFLAALAAVLGALAPGGRGDRVRLLALLLLPLAIPALALVAAVAPTLAGVLRDAAPWIALAALGAGLARVWRGPHDARTTWDALLLAGAVAACWTLLDALLRWAPGAGPFGRPGIAGPVLAALLAARVALPGARRARWVAIVLLALACVATLSRTGIVAGLLAVPAAGLVARAGDTRRLLVRGAVGALLAAAVGLAAAEHVDLPGGGVTLRVRLGLWRATADLVQERPLTGHGLGSFPAEILRVREPEEAALSRGRRPMVAHNDVLHASAEGGLGSGLALALYLALGLALALTAARAAPGAGDRALPAAAFGALLALGVAGLGEDVLLDPAGVLVAGVAAATAAALALRDAMRSFGPAVPVLLLLGLVSLGVAGVKGRDLLADVHLRRYRDVVRGGVDPVTETTAAQEHLVEGALAWRADDAEALYRLGVHRAELGDYDAARESWRRALAADPGATENWLEIERTYENEGRKEDARAALLEALRHDPTRYDLHVRLGHLALGEEPVPGEAPGDDFDPIEAHRHYNAAELVGPDRFETWVARARVARRLGRLAEAAEDIRRANAMEPNAAETLLEGFRLAEVERKTADLGTAAVLSVVLTTHPELAPRIEREAEDLVAKGREREAAARKAVEGTLTAPDYAAADRAYDAAARRLTGLVLARRLDPGAALARATQDEKERAWRPALARLRAVLYWALTAPPELGSSRREWLRSVADVLERAAQAATRTDGALARSLYAQAHAAQGALLLEDGEYEAAKRLLEKAARETPRSARVRVDLAHALVHLKEFDAAEQALLDALDLDPGLGYEILNDGDFQPVVGRPALSRALR